MLVKGDSGGHVEARSVGRRKGWRGSGTGVERSLEKKVTVRTEASVGDFDPKSPCPRVFVTSHTCADA